MVGRVDDRNHCTGTSCSERPFQFTLYCGCGGTLWKRHNTLTSSTNICTLVALQILLIYHFISNEITIIIIIINIISIIINIIIIIMNIISIIINIISIIINIISIIINIISRIEIIIILCRVCYNTNEQKAESGHANHVDVVTPDH